MHHHSGSGQAGQLTSPYEVVSVERLHIFQMVDSTQSAEIATVNDAVRLCAGRQPRERSQCRCLVATVALPSNRVVGPQVEGRCQFAGRTSRPPRLGPYPAASHGTSEMPPGHPPFDSRPLPDCNGQPFQKEPCRSGVTDLRCLVEQATPCGGTARRVLGSRSGLHLCAPYQTAAAPWTRHLHGPADRPLQKPPCPCRAIYVPRVATQPSWSVRSMTAFEPLAR